jgi:hypothetical protein
MVNEPRTDRAKQPPPDSTEPAAAHHDQVASFDRSISVGNTAALTISVSILIGLFSGRPVDSNLRRRGTVDADKDAAMRCWGRHLLTLFHHGMQKTPAGLQWRVYRPVHY